MTKDVVKQIRKATSRKFTADEKIRIVLEGLRGEISMSKLCRRGVCRINIPATEAGLTGDIGKINAPKNVEKLA
jgi:hypothetical protein